MGTRASALALAQSRMVADGLEAASPGLEVEIVPIRTSGDEGVPAASDAAGDKSDFVKEIEEALLDERADLAVHSAKDVPGGLPDGLAIVSVPARADARDTVCGADSLAALPEGARVGTSSLRRRSQVLALRPDLEVRELRGNVDTRLRRLEEGAYEALVLAAAGLARLGLHEGAPVAAEELVPAAGQGCLALEARAEDAGTAALAELLTDRGSLVRLTAERAVISGLGASCNTPVGVHAELDSDGLLQLAAYVGLSDGSLWVRDALTGDGEDPAALGMEMVDRLLAAGAGEILAAADLEGAA